MCGIVGVLQREPTIGLEAVKAGRDILKHRGPDGSGIWFNNSASGSQIVLAHRRLSIIDLSERGAQPLILTDDRIARPARVGEKGRARYALSYNGEVYNFVELRSELRRLGHQFDSDCDTEVVLRAYEQWGSACVTRFNGMFAFAIWDTAKEELFCARDRFGEKPFHYVIDHDRGIFAFASEIKALVRMRVVDPQLDDRAVYRYLRFGEQAGVTQSIWRKVLRLPPAHCMRVSVRRGDIHFSIDAYWHLDLEARTSLSFTDQVVQFRELFRDSVSLRLRSDVPVGTGLSGGIDSSSVVCQIRELGITSGQQTFTARMADPRLDESAYAELVASHANVVAHSIIPTADALLTDLDALFFAQEEPFQSTSMFSSFLVSRLARDHGVVVLLDGQGADEYLAGYSHYPALILSHLASRGRFGEWWQERSATRARIGIDPVPIKAAVYHFLHRRNGAGEGLGVDAYRAPNILRGDFSATMLTEEPRQIPITGTPLRTRLYADLLLGHLQELLRYSDRNSMHFSREVRMPFLDHRLVEFALSLPDCSLFHRGESKRVLRAAMRGIVPNRILDRRDKVGFATPWSDWWAGKSGKRFEELLEQAERHLDAYVAPGIVRPGTSEAFSIIGLARASQLMRAA